jgi:hypothetical protein
MGQYWTIANLSRGETLDPSRYGAGLKLFEFLLERDTLKVFYHVLQHWKDDVCKILITDTTTDSLRDFKLTSLIELGLTTPRKDLFAGNDPLCAEKIGLVTLLPEKVKLPEADFWIVNTEEKTYVRVDTEFRDNPARIATLLWLFVDEESLSQEIHDTFRRKKDTYQLCGLWSRKAIVVITEQSMLPCTSTHVGGFEKIVENFKSQLVEEKPSHKRPANDMQRNFSKQCAKKYKKEEMQRALEKRISMYKEQLQNMPDILAHVIADLQAKHKVECKNAELELQSRIISLFK